MSKPANLTQMLRDEEFTFVGLCADGSVRVGARGKEGGYIQYPVGHARHSEAVALVNIADADDFESAVMAHVYR